MTRYLGLLLGCLAAATAACGESDDHGHGTTTGAASGATCSSGSTLTYESFGRPFVEKYCTGCHHSSLSGVARNGAPDGHDFDTLRGIIQVAGHIDEQAAAGPQAVNTLMPPTEPKPSEDERRQLGEWLACERAGPRDAAPGGG